MSTVEQLSLKHRVELSAQMGQALLSRSWMVVTAESCTGGGIASAMTDVPGSSQWVAGGLVTYTNALKEKLLKVPHDMLLTNGAVSEPVAQAMARGAIAATKADVAVAVTGIAGPSGEVPGKPVGTVYVAICIQPAPSKKPIYEVVSCCHFDGSRADVREQTIRYALQAILDGITKNYCI